MYKNLRQIIDHWAIKLIFSGEITTENDNKGKRILKGVENELN